MEQHSVQVREKELHDFGQGPCKVTKQITTATGNSHHLAFLKDCVFTEHEAIGYI